jgi:hypothetical protein
VRRARPDKPSLTRKTCQSFVGVAFLAVSGALTGTAQLRATDDERRDIGGAIADGLSYLDDASPFVKLLNFLGPWAGVIDGLANAVFSRVVYIAEHRRRAGAGDAGLPPHLRGRVDVDAPASATNGRATFEDEEIVAPTKFGVG